MVFEKIRELIAEKIECSVDEIQEDTEFEALGIDSLDVAELVINLEDEFSIKLELDSSVKSVKDLITMIEGKLA